MPAETSAPSPDASRDSPRARLERVILTGGDGQLRDGCFAANVWSQVDAPDAGRLLDALVASYAAARALPVRDRVACYPSAVHGRLIRRWRVGELDVDAELRHPNPKLRAAMIVLAARAHARPEAVRAALGDPDFEVRMKAFTAVGDAKDHAAEPQLEAIIARVPPEGPTDGAVGPRSDGTYSAQDAARLDRRWACTTLATIRGTSPCPDVKTSGEVGLVLSGSGPTRGRCEELREQLGSSAPAVLRRGLFGLLLSRSHSVTEPFEPTFTGHTRSADCGTTDAELEPFLTHQDAIVRSFAAAVLLATHHPALPTTPAALSSRR